MTYGRVELVLTTSGFIRVLLDTLRGEPRLDPRLYAAGIPTVRCSPIGSPATCRECSRRSRRGQRLRVEAGRNPGAGRLTDGTRVRRLAYSGCREDTEVVLYTIEGGGHTWPGGPAVGRRVGRVTREIDATRPVWDFFQRHARP